MPVGLAEAAQDDGMAEADLAATHGLGRQEVCVQNDGLAEPDLPGPGLYLHFPWCVKKCPYCDFNSHPLAGSLDEDGYVRALIQDFRANARGLRFATVFLGGGTPSLFSPDAIASLLEALRPQLQEGAEISLEANPGALERGAFSGYRQAGVNRLSIGAQSFSNPMLAKLGRIHSADAVQDAFSEARQGGFDNINLDLMYALPEQRVQQALADLRRAIALRPDHLSWYQLTIEPRTEFARRPPPTPNEDQILNMEAEGRALLADAGYRRYEVSAYARSGAQCRHNLVYWTFGDYVGLGAGAAGKLSLAAASSAALELAQTEQGGAQAPRDGAVRTDKPRQPRLYLRDPTRAAARVVPPQELAGEFMMNALRLTEGLERACFTARTGLPWACVQQAWARTTSLGLTVPARIAATDFGYRHLDRLIQFFL